MIDTERLLLRRWKSNDQAPFAQLCADPEVMRYVGDGSTWTAEQAARAIASIETDWQELGFGLFAVELKQTGRFIGFTGLSQPRFLPELFHSIEIGWRLSKQVWRNGYASEAARAALAFAIDQLGNTDIVSIVQVGNEAPARIASKLGMIFDHRTIDPTCGRAIEIYRLTQPSA